MKVVRNNEIEWVNDTTHDMLAGFNDFLPANNSADIMFASIEPGHTLPRHWHTRPLDSDGTDNGYESFFFYQVAQIIVLRRNEEIEFDEKEPFTLTFYSGEEDMHGIKNLSNKPVLFQVLTAPRFDENEEHIVN